MTKLVPRPARLLAAPLAALVVAGLAACGSHAPAASPTSQAPSEGGSISPAAATSPAAPTGLRVTATIALGAGPAKGAPVVAEAPDGSVFYATGPVVMVVDGNHPPAVAEHAGATVLGLGASPSTLFVVTVKGLTAYSRTSGNQSGHWALTGSPGTLTSAGVTPGDDGTVWVWTDWATDQSGYEYANVYVVPAGAHAASMLSQNAEPGTLVTDGLNGYFLASGKNSQDTSLAEWQDATGKVVTGDAAPTQALAAFSRGQVVLYESGSGLHEYAPGGSAGNGPRVAGFAHTTVAEPDGFAATSEGLLFLTCTAAHCATVTQVNQSTGAAGQSVTIAGSDRGIWQLAGPAPAVLETASGQMHLIRLS